jgi:hypothetical protein
MAFPKKGLRKITVDGVKYGYVVSGNDGWIDFHIGLVERNGEILTGKFSYHSIKIPNDGSTEESQNWAWRQRMKLTPKTIRQIIEYGLKNGWNPHEKTGLMDLRDMDDQIELNFEE